MADPKTSRQKIRNIILAPHNPAWAGQFRVAAEQLAGVLGPEVITIEHAGSTAIQGIKAKPTLDFLVIVHHIEKIDQYNDRLIAMGYEALGENDIPGRRYFTKTEAGRRLQNVHTFQTGHPEIERMLLFRDYLRAHPAEAKAYSQIKESLARQYPQDIEGYTEGKSEFIETIIRRAKAGSA